MRVDGRGVATRGLWGWREWTWADMWNGRVRMKSLLRFDHDRAIGRQLSLELLAPADAHRVSRLCRLACVHSAAPNPLPVEITFCDEWNRRVRCTRDGLYLPRHSGRLVAWSDVVRLRIERVARESHGFQRLELQIGDRAIKALAIQQWAVRAVNDEATIVQFLIEHLPQDRVSVISLGDPPQSIREAEELLVENQAKLKKSQNVLRWWPVICVGLVIYCWLTGLSHMILLTAFLGLKYQWIFSLLGKPFRCRQRLLETARDALLAGLQPDADDPQWTMIRV